MLIIRLCGVFIELVFMHAVLEAGGAQYRVRVGDVISTDRVGTDVGSVHEFGSVLHVGSKVGLPYISGASVKAEVLEHTRGKKIIVFKKKRRKNYRRKHGHKQDISVLRVVDIVS